jgi:GDP-mannose 6-dehydrogenase
LVHCLGNESQDQCVRAGLCGLCHRSLRNGKLDIGHLEPVCRDIAQTLNHTISFHLIVLRSTVLPGTAESLIIPLVEKVSDKKFGQDFGVCVNPEFMREGSAVADFQQPALTVIGGADSRHIAELRDLYSSVPGRIFETSLRSAEMVKYDCNAWHALKVAFANEAGSMAKELGVDAESVFEMFCADTRLNMSASYLKPGFAFGGSCLRKDVRALNYPAK